ncbi:MAG: hypothetical protein LLG04_14185 [Parachlamydia sp.]|nr:hypothetical protein [Parachlamydia sp.]
MMYDQIFNNACYELGRTTMNITNSDIQCSIHRALLGAVTNNLRAVNIEKVGNEIDLLPSEEEDELSEIVVTEMYADFWNIPICP